MTIRMNLSREFHSLNIRLNFAWMFIHLLSFAIGIRCSAFNWRLMEVKRKSDKSLMIFWDQFNLFWMMKKVGINTRCSALTNLTWLRKFWITWNLQPNGRGSGLNIKIYWWNWKSRTIAKWKFGNFNKKFLKKSQVHELIVVAVLEQAQVFQLSFARKVKNIKKASQNVQEFLSTTEDRKIWTKKIFAKDQTSLKF